MAKKPRYGYARDRYGRIQDRDSYQEETHTIPPYDYSLFDSEDDHDNYYYGTLGEY